MTTVLEQTFADLDALQPEAPAPSLEQVFTEAFGPAPQTPFDPQATPGLYAPGPVAGIQDPSAPPPTMVTDPLPGPPPMDPQTVKYGGLRQAGPDDLTYTGPPANRPLKEELTTGIQRGLLQMGSSGRSLMGMAADKLGQDEFSQRMMDAAKSDLERTQMRDMAPLVKSLYQVQNGSDFIKWVVGSGGEQVPILASFVLAGSAPGIVGKAGLTALAVGLETGSIGTDIYSEYGLVKPEVALGYGTAAGMLDALPVMRIMGKTGGGRIGKRQVLNRLKKMGYARAMTQEGFKQMVLEGGTEGIQTIIEQAALHEVDANRKWFTPEDIEEIVNATALGGIMGKAMGAPTGISAKQTATQQLAADDQLRRDFTRAVERKPTETPPKVPEGKKTPSDTKEGEIVAPGPSSPAVGPSGAADIELEGSKAGKSKLDVKTMVRGKTMTVRAYLDGLVEQGYDQIRDVTPKGQPQNKLWEISRSEDGAKTQVSAVELADYFRSKLKQTSIPPETVPSAPEPAAAGTIPAAVSEELPSAKTPVQQAEAAGEADRPDAGTPPVIDPLQAKPGAAATSAAKAQQKSEKEYYQHIRETQGNVVANKRTPVDLERLKRDSGIPHLQLGPDDTIRPVMHGGAQPQVKFTAKEESEIVAALEAQGFLTDKRYRKKKGQGQISVDIMPGMGVRAISGKYPTSVAWRKSQASGPPVSDKPVSGAKKAKSEPGAAADEILDKPAKIEDAVGDEVLGPEDSETAVGPERDVGPDQRAEQTPTGRTQEFKRRAVASGGLSPQQAAKISVSTRPLTRHQKVAAGVAKKLGGEVIFLSGFTKNGAQLGRTWFIADDTNNPEIAVLGHEIYHTLQQESADDPQLAANLKTFNEILRGAVNQKTLADLFFDEKKRTGRTKERIFEEYAADFVGEAFANPNFWNRLQRQDQSLYDRIAQALFKILRRLGITVPSQYSTQKDVKPAQLAALWRQTEKMIGQFIDPTYQQQDKRKPPVTQTQKFAKEVDLTIPGNVKLTEPVRQSLVRATRQRIIEHPLYRDYLEEATSSRVSLPDKILIGSEEWGEVENFLEGRGYLRTYFETKDSWIKKYGAKKYPPGWDEFLSVWAADDPRIEAGRDINYFLDVVDDTYQKTKSDKPGKYGLNRSVLESRDLQAEPEMAGLTKRLEMLEEGYSKEEINAEMTQLEPEEMPAQPDDDIPFQARQGGPFQARKQPWEMTKEEWFAADKRLNNANERKRKAQEALGGDNRWGEARRFQGKSAGLRIDRLDAARESWSKAYDAAAKKHISIIQSAVAGGKPVPAAVLEEYRTEPWAATALKKLPQKPGRPMAQKHLFDKEEQTVFGEQGKLPFHEPSKIEQEIEKRPKIEDVEGQGDMFAAEETRPVEEKDFVVGDTVRIAEKPSTNHLEPAAGKTGRIVDTLTVKGKVRSWAVDIAGEEYIIDGLNDAERVSEPKMQERKKGPIWFLKSVKALQEKMPKLAPVQMVRGLLAKAGIKADEMTWAGIDEFLADVKAEGKVNKQELIDFIVANDIAVEEVVLGDKSDLYIDQEEHERISEAAANHVREWMVDDINRLADEYKPEEAAKIRNALEDWAVSAGADQDAAEILETKFLRPGLGMSSTMEEILDDARSNTIVPSPSETKFKDFTLPGGENYRELLLTMPARETQNLEIRKLHDRWVIAHKGYDAWYEPKRFHTEKEARQYLTDKYPSESQPYRSSHWDTPNVLVHIRFTERTDAEGNRVLFIEEIQSDWHQEGRKKGYEGVPDAPFKKTWHELAMKRMIRWAAENGFDKLAWTTGAQQVERFEEAMRQRVDEINWSQDGNRKFISVIKDGDKVVEMSIDSEGIVKAADLSYDDKLYGKHLSDVIGKGPAEKILAEESGTLTGSDLTIGGEGMKGFYDRMLPAAVNKYVKRWGVKVKPTNVKASGYDNVAQEMGVVLTEGEKKAVWGLDITPAIAESVLEGQQKYQERRPAPGEPEFEPEPELLAETSARKVDIVRDRQALGLAEIPSAARHKWSQALDEAAEQGLPEKAPRLAAMVIEDPRALSDTETAGLVLKMVELKNEHRRLTLENNELDDPVDMKLKTAEITRVQEEFDLHTLAVKMSGTEKGRALAAQKLTLDQDFDLISIVSRAKAAKGKALTESERAKLADMTAKLELQTVKIADLEKQVKKLQADRIVKRRRDESRKRRAAIPRPNRLDELYARLETLLPAEAIPNQERKEAMQFQARRAEASELAQLITDVAMIEAATPEVKNLDDVVQRMQGRLPNITLDQVIDAIVESTTGTNVRKQIGDAAQRMNEIKKEARLHRGTQQRIDTLAQHLKEQTLPETKVRPDTASKSLKTLRAIRADLYKQLRKSEPAVRERLIKQMDTMTETLESADYALSVPRSGMPETKELERLIYDRNRLRQEINRRIRALKPKTVVEKFADPLNLSRAVMTSWDVSAVLRQGGFIALGHPVRGARSLPTMFKALVSKRSAAEIYEEIMSRPNAPLYARGWLYLAPVDGSYALTQQEEHYMTHWADKVPGIAASQRAYVAYLNKLRADSFDAIIENLSRHGEPTQAEIEAAANYVNVATGRGKLPLGMEKAAVGLNTVFFAPRYVTSRINLLTGQPLRQAGSARLKGIIAADYARYMMGLGVVVGLGIMAGGDWEPDPRSSDFGKLRFGRTRLDVMSGLSQVIVLGARLVTGEIKSTTTGEVTRIRRKGDEKVPYGKMTTSKVLTRFLRSKLSPMAGAGWSALAGETYDYQPATPGRITQNLFTPLALRDFYDVIVEHGLPKGTAMGLAALLGVGVMVYQDRTKKKTGSKSAGGKVLP